MRKYLIAACLWIGLFFISFNAMAELGSNYYQATVPVASTAQPDWLKSVKAALQDVLVKVSGNNTIMNLPIIAKSAANPANLVQSYNYVTGTDGKLALQVTFNATAINQLLRDSHQVVVSKDRQQVLVWIAFQTAEGQSILHSSDNPLVVAMRNAANQQNIPLLWPLMDLQDVIALPQSKLISLEQAPIVSASERYKAKNILAGTVFQTTQGQWQANWLFIHNAQFMHWTTQGPTPAIVLTAVLSNLAQQTLPPAVAVNESQKTALTLNITGVNGLDDYANVVKYLKSLGPVTDVNATQMGDNKLELQVTVVGGIEALNQALSVTQQLVAEPAPAANLPAVNTITTPILYYHWQSTMPTTTPPVTNTMNTGSSAVPSSTSSTSSSTTTNAPAEVDL